MEQTPKSQSSTDSDCYLDSSHSPVRKAPVMRESTPISFMASRKRKACCVETFPSPPHTPQFSSTLNESLMENLEKFHLQNETISGYLQRAMFSSISESSEIEDKLPFNKIQRGGEVKFVSAPNTPEKQTTPTRGYPRKAHTNSFVKNFSQISVHTQSPLNKEAYDILYPDLPQLESLKKAITPHKIKDRLDSATDPANKSLSKRELLKKIVTNPIIMQKILKELSTGDLYRLSQVSVCLENAILDDVKASGRFITYMKAYHSHKENYKITPPSSPEKDAEEDGSLSPSTRKHQGFWEMASELNKSQHLIKCPMCTKPAVVESSIAYCQAISCGYIHCRKCNSFAYNPKDFKDNCSKFRNQLGDLSNSGTSGYVTDTTGSFFSSPSFNLNISNKSDVSGGFSECENSTPRQNVKRNLYKSFAGSAKRKVEIFSNNNRIVTSTPPKTQRRTSLVPSIPAEALQKSTEHLEPTSSPPRTKQYAACSKQSKKNLKRLTH